MTLKKCNFCANQVPKDGQCNKCGFVDGFNRPPSDEEFKSARKINEQEKYDQYNSIDMLLLD